jgi:hypothetical protein
MVDTTLPIQIVIFTTEFSITGGVFLHDQRLSDFMNDRRETTILLRNASVARLDSPARILMDTPVSVVPKTGIVLAFEAPQKVPPRTLKFIKVPKEKYNVFLVSDGMQVRGNLNILGPLDLRNAITNASGAFLPITQAAVTLIANPSLLLKEEAVMVNVQRIRLIGVPES